MNKRELVEWVIAAMEARSMSKAELARTAKVQRNFVNRFLDPEGAPAKKRPGNLLAHKDARYTRLAQAIGVDVDRFVSVVKALQEAPASPTAASPRASGEEPAPLDTLWALAPSSLASHHRSLLVLLLERAFAQAKLGYAAFAQFERDLLRGTTRMTAAALAEQSSQLAGPPISKPVGAAAPSDVALALCALGDTVAIRGELGASAVRALVAALCFELASRNLDADTMDTLRSRLISDTFAG